MSLSMFTPQIKCEKMLKIDLLPKLVNEGENQGACHLHWQLKNADYPKNFYILFYILQQWIFRFERQVLQCYLAWEERDRL